MRSVRAAMLLSMRSQSLYGGAFAILLIVPDVAHAATGLDGTALRWPWALPFIGILVTIAIGPLLSKRFWHRHYGKLAFAWSVLTLAPLAAVYGAPAALAAFVHTVLAEYLSFIVLLFALYVVAGGILVTGELRGTPLVNAAMLAFGTLIASVVGTTGAAMILIRPLIRANSARLNNVHVVVFFIFLVANIGGALSPLGDPPLFVGFLHGVDFFWTVRNIWFETALVAGWVLAVFVALDVWYYRKDRLIAPVGETKPPTKLAISGGINLLLIAGIIVAMLAAAAWKPVLSVDVYGTALEVGNIARDAALVLIAILSLALTPNEHREANGFTWEPIAEVAILFAGIEHGHHRNDTNEDAGEQDGHFRDRFPGEAVSLAMFVRRQHEREDCDQRQRAIARDGPHLECGAVNVDAQRGLPRRGGEHGDNDAGDQQQIDAAADGKLRRRPGLAHGCGQAVLAVVPDIERDEDGKHPTGDERGFEPDVARRPEEIDAVHEADEERRIAERRQRAADIGDEKDEEHDHVDVVEPRSIGADERADEDHGGAGGARHAGDQGAEREHHGVDEGRAAQLSRHQDAAGDHVEREQQHDEAQVFGEHGMHESGERGRRAVDRGKRRQREHAPGEGELAVMAVPESRKQQRAGRDGDENADEGQRPRPAQRRAVDAGGGVRHVRRDEKNRGEDAAVKLPAHRDQA